MAKIRASWSEKTYEKWIKEGRGQGTGKDYTPWLKIQDVPSEGIVSRIRGQKTQRIHHVFSGLEANYLILLDNNDDVLDIREQFPLPLSETVYLSAEMNIRHPRVPGCLFPFVMTVDFFITMKDGRYVARSIKPSAKLDEQRICDKLMLEREFCVRKGIDWKIVTEKEINEAKADNLRWLNYDGSEWSDSQIQVYEQSLLQLYPNKDIPFRTILEILEEGYSLPAGSGIAVFKHAVRTGKIAVDLERKINLLDPRL